MTIIKGKKTTSSWPPKMPQPVRVSQLRKGTVIADRYVIISETHETTTLSAVFAAHDQKLDRLVALKITDRNDKFALRCFETEAIVLKDNYHPMFPRYYDSGQSGRMHYIAMEGIGNAVELSDLIKKLGRMPLSQILEITIAVLYGLQALHDNGWVHRDVKPRNILVNKRVRLVDFGFACRVGFIETHSRLICGTYQYLSPEQAANRPVQRCSDLYSLALVLYEMLDGKNPMFDPSPKKCLENNLSVPMPLLPAKVIKGRIDPQKAADTYTFLRDLIMQMTKKKPEQRIQSANEIIPKLKALSEYISGSTPSPPLPHPTA